MSRFKVGDRVRMKDDYTDTFYIDWAGFTSIKIGEVRRIQRVANQDGYITLDNGRKCWCRDIEVVPNKNVIGGELC